MDIVNRHEPSLDEKITRPSFWGTFHSLTAFELKQDDVQECLDLIRDFLIPEETLCKSLEMIKDLPGTETLLYNAQDCMRDQTSLVIRDPDADNLVVAVLVGRVVQELEHMRSYSRIKVVQGDTYQKYLALRCHLQKKADLFNHFSVNAYYRIYHIVVHPEYRKRGLASYLVLLATQRLTRLFKQTICTAIAPSRPMQRLLAKHGFSPFLVLPYHEWLENGHQVFNKTGVGNYNVILCVYQVPPDEAGTPVNVTPIIIKPPEEEEAEDEPITSFPRGAQQRPRAPCKSYRPPTGGRRPHGSQLPPSRTSERST